MEENMEATLFLVDIKGLLEGATPSFLATLGFRAKVSGSAPSATKYKFSGILVTERMPRIQNTL